MADIWLPGLLFLIAGWWLAHIDAEGQVHSLEQANQELRTQHDELVRQAGQLDGQNKILEKSDAVLQETQKSLELNNLTLDALLKGVVANAQELRGLRLDVHGNILRDGQIIVDSKGRAILDKQGHLIRSQDRRADNGNITADSPMPISGGTADSR
jgi:hypothetical protein